ncbi:hypothetical protein Hanom_Chr04g00322221 [Helianthus anomalus]
MLTFGLEEMSMRVTNWYSSSWLCFKRSSKFEKKPCDLCFNWYSSLWLCFNYYMMFNDRPQRQQREEGRCIPLLTIACIVVIRPLGKQKDGPLAGPTGSI